MEITAILIIFAIIWWSIVYGINQQNKISWDNEEQDKEDNRDIKLFCMYVSALKLKYDLEITNVRAFWYSISINWFMLYEVDCHKGFIQIQQELEERISLYEELKSHFSWLEQANKIMKKAKKK